MYIQYTYVCVCIYAYIFIYICILPIPVILYTNQKKLPKKNEPKKCSAWMMDDIIDIYLPNSVLAKSAGFHSFLFVWLVCIPHLLSFHRPPFASKNLLKPPENIRKGSKNQKPWSISVTPYRPLTSITFPYDRTCLLSLKNNNTLPCFILVPGPNEVQRAGSQDAGPNLRAAEIGWLYHIERVWKVEYPPVIPEKTAILTGKRDDKQW
jgi:hypothetical protein